MICPGDCLASEFRMQGAVYLVVPSNTVVDGRVPNDDDPGSLLPVQVHSHVVHKPGVLWRRRVKCNVVVQHYCVH